MIPPERVSEPVVKQIANILVTDKLLNCEHCGLRGHRRSECYKLQAAPTTPLVEGDLMAKKRKREVAALERQLAGLKLEETELFGHVHRKHPAECCRVGVSVSVCGSRRRGKWLVDREAGIDSGAEVTVCPPELAPASPTEESEESRSGVKCWRDEANFESSRDYLWGDRCWQFVTCCSSRLKEAGLNIERLAT